MELGFGDAFGFSALVKVLNTSSNTTLLQAGMPNTEDKAPVMTNNVRLLCAQHAAMDHLSSPLALY